MSSTIDALKAEGVLSLYHDYRAGHVQDLSGNANHGTMTATAWADKGLDFPSATSKVTVSDSARLQGAAFTLLALSNCQSQITNEYLISKRDAGGNNYAFFKYSNTSIGIYDGAGTRGLAVNTIGTKCQAVSFSNGTVGKVYLDGAYAGDLSSASVTVANDAPVIMGNSFSNNARLQSTLDAAIIISRILTATEHANLYAELSAMRWPSRARLISMPSLSVDPSESGLIVGYNMKPEGDRLIDVSSSGFDGTIDGATHENTTMGPALRFDGVDDYINVDSIASTNKTYTFSMWVNTSTGLTTNRFIFDSSGGRLILGFYTSTSGKIGFYDGSWHDLGDSPNDGLWHHLVWLFDSTAGEGKLYKDGTQFGSTLSYTGCDLGSSSRIFSNFNNTGSYLNGSILNFHIYDELKSTDWITAEYNRGKTALWKTDYGPRESVAAVTAGHLDDTPFIVDSGGFKISTDTIEGKTCKVIECTTAGVCYVPVSELGQTPTEAAYGEWEWWVNHATASRTKILLIASGTVSGSSSGYNLDIFNTELIALQRTNVTNIMSTAASYITAGAWFSARITRSAIGAFTVYINDTLMDVTGGGGTNPVTDNNVTTANYFVLEFGTGDKIAYSDITGNHSIIKKVLS